MTIPADDTMQTNGSSALRKTPLERYVKVLEAIAVAPHAPSLSDIAKRCDLPHATSHRLIATLLRTGLVQKEAGNGRQYALGPRLLRLLHFGTDSAYVGIMVQPLLNELADRLRNTCFLVQLSDGLTVRSIAWAVPERGIRGFVVPGHIMPPHAAASAKAILAYQDQDSIDQVLSQALPKLTPQTRTDPQAILADYSRVRELGYATCWDEWETGLGALACPVNLPDFGVLYSVGVSGLATRLKEDSLDETVAVLSDAARELARQLPLIMSKGSVDALQNV